MLRAHDITKTYNEKILLNNVSFVLGRDKVTALIGKNGAGKSTLLKILVGQVKPDSGHIALDNEVVSYVAQEPIRQDQTIEQSFGSIEPWRIKYVLKEVELPSKTNGLIKDLSGGQKTRLALAHVLAKDPKPTLLLLDEPTNNLDSDGLLWLERFILKFKGTILLASHDRHFINVVARCIIEIKKGRIELYSGDYDFYLNQRTLQQQRAEREYSAHNRENRRIAKMVQDAKQRASKGVRQKNPPDNDKTLWTFKNEGVQRSLANRAKALETRLEKLGEKGRPEFEKNYSFLIEGAVSHKKRVVRLSHVSKHFEQQKVLNDISLEIRGNDRVHVQGKNGSGKSTLMKIIAKNLAPDSGNLVYGEAIRVGYFSQDSDGLDYEVSALENFETTDLSATKILQSASRFGLTPDDLRKMPGELSRGQQAKLSFMKLLLSSYSLLVLDEPTNHLDIATKEKLEAALGGYQGALLIASHDRYFIKTLDITGSVSL